MKEVSAGDILDIKTGKYDANHAIEDGAYKFFTCALEPFLADTFSFDDEVLILPGNGANVGEVMHYEGKLEAYQRTYVLHNIQENPRYLYYYFKKYWVRQITKRQVGSATNYIKMDDIVSFKIPLPPLETQKKIAFILDAADAYRQKTKALIEKYDELTQSLFLEMFGDPVTNPKGWEKKTIFDLVNPDRPITYGILMPKENIKPDGIPYIKVVDVKNGEILDEQVCHTSNEIESKYKRSRLKKDDVLISIRGHVGRVCLVPKRYEEANITQDTARLDFNETVSPQYAEGCLNTIEFQRHMNRFVKGAGVKGINLGDLKKLQIPVASIERQQLYKKEVLSIKTQKAQAQQSLEKAEELFNSLLQKAFKGEIAA